MHIVGVDLIRKLGRTVIDVVAATGVFIGNTKWCTGLEVGNRAEAVFTFCLLNKQVKYIEVFILVTKSDYVITVKVGTGKFKCFVFVSQAVGMARVIGT